MAGQPLTTPWSPPRQHYCPWSASSFAKKPFTSNRCPMLLSATPLWDSPGARSLAAGNWSSYSEIFGDTGGDGVGSGFIEAGV